MNFLFSLASCAGRGLYEVDYRLGVDVRVVNPCPQKVVSLQVDLDARVWVEFIGERIHEPGFADLSCAHQDKRLALAAVVPVDDLPICVSLHGSPFGAYYITSGSHYSIE